MHHGEFPQVFEGRPSDGGVWVGGPLELIAWLATNCWS